MKRYLLTALCSAGLLAAAPGAAVAAGVAGELRWRSDLAVPARSADDLVAVRLDGAIADATAAGFADLRIIDSADREVPLVIRTDSVVKERTVRTSHPVAGPRLEPRDDGGVEITLTIDPLRHKALIHGFAIITPLVNFQQRVRVERQDADGEWTVLVEDGLLCDYSQWMDVRTTGIPFPADHRATAGGTYRITIAEATAEQQSRCARWCGRSSAAWRRGSRSGCSSAASRSASTGSRPGTTTRWPSSARPTRWRGPCARGVWSRTTRRR